LSPGETLTDSPIKIKGTQTKGSYMQLGAVNDVTALKRSSNVYMFYTALRLGGDFRYPFPNNSKANVDADGGIQKLRNYYNQDRKSTPELQSRFDLVCRLLLEKKKEKISKEY